LGIWRKRGAFFFLPSSSRTPLRGIFPYRRPVGGGWRSQCKWSYPFFSDSLIYVIFCIRSV
jgi:hypothetical protein